MNLCKYCFSNWTHEILCYRCKDVLTTCKLCGEIIDAPLEYCSNCGQKEQEWQQLTLEQKIEDIRVRLTKMEKLHE